MKRLAKILPGVLLVLCVSLPSFAQQRVVKGSYINVRKDGNFKSPVVTKKLRGDTYTLHFEKEGWAKVTFTDGTEGWVYLTNIERAGETTVSEAPEEELAINLQPRVQERNPVIKTTTADAKKTQPPKPTPVPPEPDKPEVKPVVPPKPPAPKQKSVTTKPPKPIQIAKATIPVLPAHPESPSERTTSKTAEEFYNEAITFYENRKFTEALEANRMALKLAPRNAEILNNLGNCLFKMGRVDEAIKEWKNALEVSPKSAKICNNLGIAYYQIDENQKAIEYYKKAILFEPKFPDPYYNLASVHGFMGKFDDATQNYRIFLELGPDKTMRRLTEERIEYCQKQVAREKPETGSGSTATTKKKSK